MATKQVKATKAKKEAKPDVRTAVEVDEKTVFRHWDGQKLTHLKTLGGGAGASAHQVRLTKIKGEDIFTFVLREEVIKLDEDTVEATEADVAHLVHHLTNHRKCCEHPFVLPIFAWTVVERAGRPMLLMALPKCSTTIFDILKSKDNLLLAELRDNRRLYMMNALIALDHIHAMDITHRDLHTGNLFVDSSHDGEKRLLIGDFGESIDWNIEEQALRGPEHSSKLSKKNDLKRLCEMLPVQEGRPGPKTVEEEADRKLEDILRKTLTDCRMKPREVVLLGYFQGTEHAAQHPQWALDIAEKKENGQIDWNAQRHPLLAHVDGQTLQSRFFGGGCNLRLVDGLSEEGRIDVKAHVTGALEACLSPCGYVCTVAGCTKNGGLMTDEEFCIHGHEKKTGAVVAERAIAIVGKQPRVREWNVVKEATTSGRQNLVYSKEIKRCDRATTRHNTWAVETVHNIHGNQAFAYQCISKSADKHWLKTDDDQVLLVSKPQHLGEIVESARADWSDPWINFFKQTKEPCSVDEHWIAKALAANGITWQEPTPQAVLQRVNAALAKAAKNKPSTSKGKSGGKKKPPPQEKVDVAAALADLKVDAGEQLDL